MADRSSYLVLNKSAYQVKIMVIFIFTVRDVKFCAVCKVCQWVAPFKIKTE